MRRLLGSAYEVLDPSAFLDLPEPAENGTTFLENARKKATHYARLTGCPALADDSGLLIDALGGAPGVYSARYAPTPQERIDRVLNELKAVTDPKARSARFVSSMFLALPHGNEIFGVASVGTVEGTIATEMHGDDGFGYDPIFYVPAVGKTMAQLTIEEKNHISHRGNALKVMRLLMHKTL